MSHVSGGYVEAVEERRGSDDEVFKGDRETQSGLFTFDPASELGDVQRHRLYDQRVQRLPNEGCPSPASCLVIGTIHSVNDLHNADRRDRDIFIVAIESRTDKNIFDRFATTLRRDQDARV